MDDTVPAQLDTIIGQIGNTNCNFKGDNGNDGTQSGVTGSLFG
jgi:hypothetical protein